MPKDNSSLERERIVIEVGVVSVTLLLAVGQFVQLENRAEFLSFVSGIAVCFIIGALFATIFMFDDDHGIVEAAIIRLCEIVPFFVGLLMLVAMFLSMAMLIPKTANVVWFVLVFLAIAVPIFSYRTYRHLKKRTLSHP